MSDGHPAGSRAARRPATGSATSPRSRAAASRSPRDAAVTGRRYRRAAAGAPLPCLRRGHCGLVIAAWSLRFRSLRLRGLGAPGFALGAAVAVGVRTALGLVRAGTLGGCLAALLLAALLLAALLRVLLLRALRLVAVDEAL